MCLAYQGGTGALAEGIFPRHMPDGRQVMDVVDLPGSAGIKIPRRLTTEEMTFLTKEYGVEFAQTYHLGSGKNGRGGYYMLYSGTVNSVKMKNAIRPDVILINHTHPGGTAGPSPADKKLLLNLMNIGSPQKVSEIIPIGKEQTVFFDIYGIKR